MKPKVATIRCDDLKTGGWLSLSEVNGLSQRVESGSRSSDRPWRGIAESSLTMTSIKSGGFANRRLTLLVREGSLELDWIVIRLVEVPRWTFGPLTKLVWVRRGL